MRQVHLGRLAVGLLEPSAGTRLWHGEEIAQLPAGKQREIQLKIQMIFQDPYAALNPRMRVADIVGEAPLVHGLIEARAQQEYVAQLLQRVGLDASLVCRFPHQFSGGQRARIGIARALAVKPEFLVCDEAVAALDVSIQAQVLNLFIKLREEFNLTYLFISHDLGVVHHLSDRVVIMYLGRVVEAAPTVGSTPGPTTPIPRRCWPKYRGWICGARVSFRSKAKSPPRSTRRRAAISTRAARTRCPGVESNNPHCAKSRRCISPPAI
jgi:peptide/nickel transport system ATP-binding protein